MIEIDDSLPDDRRPRQLADIMVTGDEDNVEVSESELVRDFSGFDPDDDAGA